MFNGKIFGIGYPKTGTSSLNAALTLLGYESIHEPRDFLELVRLKGIYKFPEIYLKVNRRRGDVKWDALTDFGSTFYYKLDKEYPRAKFILTTRELESWWMSWINHIIDKQPKDKNGTKDYSHVLQNGNIWLFKTCDLFGGIGYDEEVCKYKYELNNCLIEKYFSDRPNDLLILPLESDKKCQLLCEFLSCEKEQLKGHYPHKNKSKKSVVLDTARNKSKSLTSVTDKNK
jgi:hypothetical protein